MGAEKWSEEEVDYLISYSIDPDTDSVRDVSKHLGRSERSIITKLMRLRNEGTIFDYVNQPWSEFEINALKNRYAITTYKELSELLGRSENAIRTKANKLGLKKNLKILHKDKQIRSLAERGYTRQEIADKLGFRVDQINGYIWLHKIRCKKVPLEERNKSFRKANQVSYAYATGRLGK